MKIDAHHHCWHYSPDEYGWIDDRMQALRRDFIPADMERELEPAHVRATVAVQARQTLEETSWLYLAINSPHRTPGFARWPATKMYFAGPPGW
jgi:L-fuconolactonase